jgi:hypothetical protein
MTERVIADTASGRYVLEYEAGYSCLGFENARAHAAQIAALLGRPEFALQEGEFGSVAGYERYRAAVAAWGQSKEASTTYFDPGTPEKVRRLLESARRSEEVLRLFFGDTDTGEDWGEEHEVVGRIGRSCGSMKLPLLLTDECDTGGGAILCACIVRILRVGDGKELYRRPNYQEPSFRFADAGDRNRPRAVAVHRTDRGKDQHVATFDNFNAACAWVGFISGMTTTRPRHVH